MSYNPSLLFYKHYYENVKYDGTKDARDKHNEKVFAPLNTMLLATPFNSALIPPLGTSVVTFNLTTTYPGLIIGSGITHGSGQMGEFKTGFHFDHTTGMPVIPGSSVKGLLRSVFPIMYKEKAKKEKNEEDKLFWLRLAENREKFVSALLAQLNITQDQGDNFIERLEREIFEGMLGTDREKKEDHFPMRDRDVFFDAVITKCKDGLLADEYITPHKNPLKNPIPLKILKVRPGVTFTFQFRLLPTTGATQRLLTPAQRCELFKQILLVLGAGAKTNTGFGHFEDGATVRTNTSTSTVQAQAASGEPSYLPLKKGNKVQGIVVENTKTPPQNIALKLYAGNPEESHIAYIRFPAGRPIGTTAAVVLIENANPLKITVLKW
jgi:CRISPR-associated protein Cmr6